MITLPILYSISTSFTKPSKRSILPPRSCPHTAHSGTNSLTPKGTRHLTRRLRGPFCHSEELPLIISLAGPKHNNFFVLRRSISPPGPCATMNYFPILSDPTVSDTDTTEILDTDFESDSYENYSDVSRYLSGQSVSTLSGEYYPNG